MSIVSQLRYAGQEKTQPASQDSGSQPAPTSRVRLVYSSETQDPIPGSKLVELSIAARAEYSSRPPPREIPWEVKMRSLEESRHPSTHGRQSLIWPQRERPLSNDQLLWREQSTARHLARVLPEHKLEINNRRLKLQIDRLLPTPELLLARPKADSAATAPSFPFLARP
jgi:hypothetical protein